MFISILSDIIYDKVILVINMYETGNLKGQKKNSGAKMCCVSGFKELRRMKEDDAISILNDCINKEIRFAEMKQRCIEMKRTRQVQIALMEGLGEKTWIDVEAK